MIKTKLLSGGLSDIYPNIFAYYFRYEIEDVCMYSFKKWRKWLIRELEQSIAESHQISLLKGEYPVQILGNSSYEEHLRPITDSDRFLERFANLCKSFGFDPRIKSHWDNFQFEEGQNVREPECGSLHFLIAENSYLFYFSQKKRIRRQREVLSDIEDLFGKRKPRLSKSIAEVIIYALETNSGNISELSRLRKYFVSSSFKNDLNLVSKSIRRKVRKHNQAEKYKIDLGSFAAPSTIAKLAVNRGETDINRWRAVWIHDLFRTVLAPERGIINKKISTTEKDSIKYKILRNGDKKMGQQAW